ncbi:AAA family ATPase [Anaerosporobacter sp.]|uniref:AAA family ATPase n=1 Tax=Anaerosporobacter sp. TaxID=1872529 RepID=UPI00286ECF4B|nr:AAA family ATPase [Anaerosporobacter sp.]
MIIKNIEIKNFKGIKELQLKLDEKFNLIVGNNGTGKTSTLEALTVALGAYLSGIDGINATHFTKDEIRMEKELLGEGSSNINYMTPVSVSCDLTLANTEFSFVRRKVSVNSSRSTIEPRDICRKASELISNSDSILPIISYQSFSRIANQKRDKWSNPFKDDFSRSVAYTDCLEDASNTKMLVNWCKKMEEVSWQLEKKIAEYEAVKTAVSKFMSIMLDTDNIRVYYDKRTDELMYSTEKETLPIRILSSGFRTLIGMIYDISYRMAILNPNLRNDAIDKTPGVVMIDELDMHLHPKWQWKIVEALKTTFPKVQFITTTHSPIIISSCKNDNIILIENAYNNNLEIEYQKTKKGWQINDVLEQIMETTNRDPETEGKLSRISFLAKKKLDQSMTSSDYEEYNSLIREIKSLLPENDIAIEEAALLSIHELIGE